jgi:peptide/nickel transport system ATP-binding protein
VSQPLLRVANLHVGFGSSAPEDDVVRDVSFTIGRSEVVAIVGESGSGKSVTSRSLVGLVGDDAQVRASRLEFNGIDLLTLTERQWRRLRGDRIGLVLQDALISLDPLRPVGREIEEVLRRHSDLTGPERRERVVELLQQCGIPDPQRRAGQIPQELSGGMRQRALIAAALAGEPDLIVADEPTTALDVTVQAQVLQLLKKLVHTGCSLLLISHDLAVVAAVADRVLVMQGGRVVDEGTVAEVLATPKHDYTRLLLDAVPSRRARRQLFQSRVEPADAHDAGPNWRDAADGQEPLLQAENLSRSFVGRDGNVVVAVDNVSFALRQGETIGIVGESGSGKSTTARLVLGLERPDHGQVTVGGRPWSALKRDELYLTRRRVQAIHQDALGTFDPRHRVEDVLSEAVRAGQPGGRRASRAEIRRQCVELLALVGLGPELLGRRPSKLSGGQRQRVAIARALAPRPDVIVCDEPVSALDVSVQAQVLDVLVNVQEQTGVAYLFISHDLGVVHHLADRVIVLRNGAVVEQGGADEVFLHPREAYTRELVEAVPRLPVAS